MTTDPTQAEIALLTDADQRARAYVADINTRRAWPDADALAALAQFDEAWPKDGCPDEETLQLLDELGSPATAASIGPRYFGYVIGSVLPAAAAAERMVIAWDQRASTFDSSPISATIEKVAGHWILDALDLPRQSAVGFGTSATACTLTCLAAARRSLLLAKGWDWDRKGAANAPAVRVVASATIHVAVSKALRILGFGLDNVIPAPVGVDGAIDPERLPPLDDSTILCLQAGEVNTGAFDPFDAIIPAAKAQGAWVHVDGAFGLWARASSSAALCAGVDGADSWTADGHKWLNTPYDSAFAICRDASALAGAMSSEAVYAPAAADAQQNLTLEFSRRARGIPIWAALRSLGKSGVCALVDRHIAQARFLAAEVAAAGFQILNRVDLNQVLVRADNDTATVAICRKVQAAGRAWFGLTQCEGRPAFRISVSSWRTTDQDISDLVDLLRQFLATERAEHLAHPT